MKKFLNNCEKSKKYEVLNNQKHISNGSETKIDSSCEPTSENVTGISNECKYDNLNSHIMGNILQCFRKEKRQRKD